MNKKAEDFKKYLETKAITCFTVEEIDDDQLNTVVFRSTIEVEGAAAYDYYFRQQHLWYGKGTDSAERLERE